ncbi:MAG: DUF1697 domain-containing protein [Acidimicrobiales bacterium]|nr:DUF1697 domain-containing protein [Acidimicrobiales bacterium]
MSAYVALLRGINPNNPKMRNAELVRVVEHLGFRQVRAVISTGNVLFESSEHGPGELADLENTIEDALGRHLDKPCSTIVRTRAEIDDLLGSDVFDGFDDVPTSRFNVTFLKDPVPPGVALPATGAGSELIAVRDQAVFSLYDSTASKTPDLMAKLEKAYGKQITTRTWKTVQRIAKAFGP